MRKYPNCDFSYAGLKTSVRLAIEAQCSPPSPSRGSGARSDPEDTSHGEGTASASGTESGGSAERAAAEVEAAEALTKTKADIAASFQRTAVIHLTERVRRGIGWAKEMEPGIKWVTCPRANSASIEPVLSPHVA